MLARPGARRLHQRQLTKLRMTVDGASTSTTDAEADSDNTGDAGWLYDKLENKVLPLFHGGRARRITIMKDAISRNAHFFNSHLMRRYVVEAYLH